MGCSLPGSSIHGIFQARVLEWGAIAFSAVTFWTFSFWKVKMKGLREGVTRAVIRATTLLSCVEGPLPGLRRARTGRSP